MVTVVDAEAPEKVESSRKRGRKREKTSDLQVSFGAPSDSFLSEPGAPKQRPTVPLSVEKPLEIGTKRPETPENGGEKGISCPHCGCQHLPVRYTRMQRRRRMRVRDCYGCGREVVTYERIANTEGV
jgi:hypothetical protein